MKTTDREGGGGGKGGERAGGGGGKGGERAGGGGGEGRREGRGGNTGSSDHYMMQWRLQWRRSSETKFGERWNRREGGGGRMGWQYHDEALGRHAIIIRGIALLILHTRVCDYHCVGMGLG